MQDDEKVTYFAETDSRNKHVRFGIKAKDRTRHIYVIGKTGMGKSTVLENMAIQDIQSGNGLAFMDPHGKTAELLLEYVPEHRINDVIYFAPFDMEYPISFNVMEDVGADKRHLVVNGLMSAFKKIWVDAWSARMEYILSNALLALLEYPDSTLLSINKMLSDKDFRKKVVDNVQDPSVKSFWNDEFAKYTERMAAEAVPAIQNKVGQFTANPLIRNIIGQSKSTFDIRQVMDNKKILIINLSKGRVGEGNANLLGSMLITKIYLAAMSRADTGEALLKKLPNFYLYVDEFQSFANESFADILSEARKYKLNLTIAHQYIEQMQDEVRSAVFGNVGTMISFRVGAYDAEVLEKEFAPTFTAEDIVNLGQFQMYLRLMIEGVGSSPFSAKGMPPIPKPDIMYVDKIIEASRKNFAHPRAEVEQTVRDLHDTKPAKSQSAQPRAAQPTQTQSRQQQQTPQSRPRVEQKSPSQLSSQSQSQSQVPQKNQAVPKPHSDSKPKPVEKPQTTSPFKEAFAKAFSGQESIAEYEVKETKPASLPIKELTKPHPGQKPKEASPESINSLRDALKAIVPPVPAAPAAPTGTPTSTPVSASVPAPKTAISTEHPKEIPEKKLRDMLHVDETDNEKSQG